MLDQTQLIHEPLWQYQPIVTSSAAIQLITEVVSSNWQNDYARKVEDYKKCLFRQTDGLVSAIFPDLQLQAEAIFAAGQL